MPRGKDRDGGIFLSQIDSTASGVGLGIGIVGGHRHVLDPRDAFRLAAVLGVEHHEIGAGFIQPIGMLRVPELRHETLPIRLRVPGPERLAGFRSIHAIQRHASRRLRRPVMRSATREHGVSPARQFSEHRRVIMGQPFRRDPQWSASRCIESAQVVPGILAPQWIARVTRLRVEERVAGLDRLELLVEGATQRRRPLPRPHLHAIHRPATHLPARVAEPDVLAVCDRCRAAAIAKAIGVDAFRLRIAREFLLPQNCAILRADAVEHDVRPLLLHRIRRQRLHRGQEKSILPHRDAALPSLRQREPPADVFILLRAPLVRHCLIRRDCPVVIRTGGLRPVGAGLFPRKRVVCQ